MTMKNVNMALHWFPKNEANVTSRSNSAAFLQLNFHSADWTKVTAKRQDLERGYATAGKLVPPSATVLFVWSMKINAVEFQVEDHWFDGKGAMKRNVIHKS